MMMKQSTQDEVNDWAVQRYASTAAPSLAAAAAPSPAPATPAASGMLGASTATPTAIAAPAPKAAADTPAPAASTWAAASTPTATPAPAPSPAATPATPKPAAPNVNVQSWYQSELGRDGDAAGLSYWQNRLNNGEDAQSLYAEFSKSAAANREAVKPVDWASANSYSGPALGNNVTFDPSKPAPAAPTAPVMQPTFPVPTAAGTAQIAKSDLATRTIDKPTETVQGQIGNVLAENSPVLQQARADAMRSANDRGMLNSAMAASGGEDAVIRSATGIATTDAGAYKSAADYNAAASNQATMWNADQTGQMQRLQMQQAADAAARTQQMQIAQMQDSTSRYQSEMSANTAKYNTDSAYKQQMDSQRQSLANNIIANTDMSPDRKAAMLESLGLGTSAKMNPDGSINPGTGLAGAAYVIGSVAADLQPPQGMAPSPMTTMAGNFSG